MKFFTIILSFYMVLLIVIPCIDTPADYSLTNTELSQQSQESQHHSDADHCSPFCTCNCCATSVIIQEYMAKLDCFSFSNQQYFPLSSDFISDQLASIWQPPKIV